MTAFKSLCLALLLAWPVAAWAKPMEFTLQEKDLRPNLDLFQWIFADGEITAGTADRFKLFVDAHPQLLSGATVIFNSPGGSLEEGLRLGEAISGHQFRTDVAVAGAGPMTREPGVCASACVFAYLGGQYRYLTTGSQIGIHRFRFTKDFGGDAATTVSQLMAGQLVNFIQKMRADTRLFTLMTETSADDIKFLSRDELTSLKVVTNDVYSEDWSYEVRNNTPYLKADQVTWRGENKLLFICQMNGGRALPYAMALSELPDREMVIREAKQVVLFVDHNAIYLPLGDRRPTATGAKYVTWDFTLSPALIASIEQAKSLGSGLSPAPGIFSGFEAIDVGDAHQKLMDFLGDCHDQQSQPAQPPVAPATAKGSIPSDMDMTRRVAHNFDAQYKKAGSNGLQLSVSACYATVANKRRIGALEYCYLFGRVCSTMDAAVTKKLGYPQTPFWLAQNVQDRANSAFTGLGQSADAATEAMTRWQNLEPLIWSQLAALPK